MYIPEQRTQFKFIRNTVLCEQLLVILGAPDLCFSDGGKALILPLGRVVQHRKLYHIGAIQHLVREVESGLIHIDRADKLHIAADFDPEGIIRRIVEFSHVLLVVELKFPLSCRSLED